MKLESRHWTFMGLFIAIVAAMILNISLRVPVSNQTQKMYDFIDSLPSGSILIFSFDHEASSLPEIRPIALSVLRHAFEKGHKLIGVSLLAEGTVIGYRLMQRTAEEYGKNYGDDYVYLGFKPQFIAAILSMGESLRETYPEDYIGTFYDSLELLQHVTNFDQVAAVVSVADGSLTTHWMEYGKARYGVDILGAVTAAMATTYDPYLSSGQMSAMVGGLRGAAEYESLINRDGGGMRGMLAQTTAHLYVIFLIVVGNVVYFTASRRKGKRQ